MQSFSDVLNLVKEYFQEKVRANELTETAYTCWIKNIQPGRFENNTAYLVVPFERVVDLSNYNQALFCYNVKTSVDEDNVRKVNLTP